MFHDTLRTEEATQEQKHKLFSSQLLLVESFQLHWLSFYLDDRDSSALHTVSVPPHKCFILIINKANQYIQYFHRSCCCCSYSQLRQLWQTGSVASAVCRNMGVLTLIWPWANNLSLQADSRHFTLEYSKSQLLTRNNLPTSKIPKRRSSFTVHNYYREFRLNMWPGAMDISIPFHHTLRLHFVSNHYALHFFK